MDLDNFSTSVVFLAGETSKLVLINTTNDTLEEGPEVFQVTLSRLDVGVVVGKPSQAVVTIIDDDQGTLEKALIEKCGVMILEGVLKMDDTVDISFLRCPQFQLLALLRVPSHFLRQTEVLL